MIMFYLDKMHNQVSSNIFLLLMKVSTNVCFGRSILISIILENEIWFHNLHLLTKYQPICSLSNSISISIMYGQSNVVWRFSIVYENESMCALCSNLIIILQWDLSKDFHFLMKLWTNVCFNFNYLWKIRFDPTNFTSWWKCEQCVF